MKRIPIKFLELHDPIFIGSKNHPPKMDAIQKGIQIVRLIDKDRDEIHIKSDGNYTTLPYATIKQAQPFNPEDADMDFSCCPVKGAVAAPPVTFQGKIKAQVSAPTGIKI